MPHSQPTAPQQTACKFHLDPQYHIFYWGSSILGDSTLWWDFIIKRKQRKCAVIWVSSEVLTIITLLWSSSAGPAYEIRTNPGIPPRVYRGRHFLSQCLDYWLPSHDDIVKWKRFPHCRPFVRGIYRSSAVPFTKGQWCGPWMFLQCLTKQTVEQTL